MKLQEKIQIISASAGSGKTYRLASLLEQEVMQEGVRPNAVLATTFTKKAAAELQERVRTRLLKVGLTTQAQQLSAARIGTVNSVCGGLLAEFAFDLGISPQQKVLEEEAVNGAIQRAMSRVIDNAVIKEIWHIEQMFPGTVVRDVVADIISKARSNCISPNQLDSCAQRSCDEFLKFYAPPAPGEPDISRKLQRAITQFLSAVDPEVDTTQDTQKALKKVRAIKNKLNQSRRIPWSDWLILAKIKTGAKSREAAEALRIIAASQDEHPELHSDTIQLIKLVFSLASKTMTAYQEYKSEWGFIDFVDQEALCLDLLNMDGPSTIIAEQLDLVLVDEFQDTSPIQLAIFMKLAALAKKSVWVGDQKQSIYGFRDADPSLMDAAIKGILGDADPETLPFSWRSRPELVHSTSDIFVNAFSQQGFPEKQVRLAPAERTLKEEPQDLSSIYEYWQLESKNKDNDILALAKAVSDFLVDSTKAVRDRHSGEKRQVRGGDVAILCRSNEVCIAVAQALETQGIAAALSRPSLLNQPEIIVSLAGVRLLLNPKDSLARAEVARFLDNPHDHDSFLQKAINEPFANGFDLEVFDHLENARIHLGLAGPLEMLDSAFEALSIRRLCHSWGNSATRLANLDALRSHCVRYVLECEDNGKGVGTAGMLAWLESQEGLPQAEVKGEDTVQVLTWHKAKGLEWPVTVLFQLDKVYPALPIGVNAVSDHEFSLEVPLAGRWLRYWPDPYLDPNHHFAVTSEGAPFHTRLSDSPITIDHQERAKRQELRLLYVGWTRSRDTVVFAGRKESLKKGIMRLLVDKDGEHLLDEPIDNKAIWAGCGVNIFLKLNQPTEGVPREFEPGIAYEEHGPREYPPAFLAASSISGEWVAKELEVLGERLHLRGQPDMQHMGESIHGFLAADEIDRKAEKRSQMATDILNRWKTNTNLEAQDMLAMSDRLHKWIVSRWPEAKIYREYPVMVQQENGTVISGFIDMLLETKDGFVIIDHKSFPGSREDAMKKAETFGGQLGIYAEGVEKATGKQVVKCFIHLPVTGIIKELSKPCI